MPKLLLAFAGLVLAGSTHAQTMTPADETAVLQALNRGQLMFAYDQAAWHATDAMLADAKELGRFEELKAKNGGWVVRPKDPNKLEVLFLDKSADAPKVLYLAVTSGNGKDVISHAFVDGDPPKLDDATLRMIRARKVAADSIKNQKVLRCAAAPFNTVVLPPEGANGAIAAYFLSPQTVDSQVPFGGHARVMVAPDGSAGPIHSFTKGCMDLPTRSAKNAPAGLVATLVLDPLPTEVSVFTMFAAGLPLYISTPDGRMWAVEAPGGRATIRLLPSDTKGH